MSPHAPSEPELAASEWALPAHEVHVWHVAPAAASVELSELLSPDERSRAAAMGLVERRRQYTGMRGALRQILAGYLDTGPRTIAFSYGARGKPELHARFAGSGLQFSVSHARAHGVIAVARASALGVDIERVVDGRRALAVAERIFAPREAARLRALADSDLPYGFTAVWTRKEAYVKALGDGLTLPLAGFEVSVGRDRAAVVRCAASDRHSPEAWTLMQAGGSVPDHVCTVAVAHGARQAPGQAIRLRELSLVPLESRSRAPRSAVAC